VSDTELRFYPKLAVVENNYNIQTSTAQNRLEPGTCTEAEPFALRVLDDSMQPEFRPGCIILIDPTGRATEGSYVLANITPDEGPIFRQLRKNNKNDWMLCALNDSYPETVTLKSLDAIMGVIVQRAGVRRKYHKHFDQM